MVMSEPVLSLSVATIFISNFSQLIAVDVHCSPLGYELFIKIFRLSFSEFRNRMSVLRFMHGYLLSLRFVYEHDFRTFVVRSCDTDAVYGERILHGASLYHDAYMITHIVIVDTHSVDAGRQFIGRKLQTIRYFFVY